MISHRPIPTLQRCEEGWGEDFSRAVYRAEFADGLAISEPSVIAGILRKLERPVEAAMTRAQGDAIKSRLREQTADAQGHKIFGAPSFTTPDGELFWGNDRLEQAIAWAKRRD
jgi:2-hydroxychromene-2-carboxylate isomerase